MASTAAQDEYDDLIAKNSARESLHPEDRVEATDSSSREDELDEETAHRNAKIEAAMRTSTTTTAAELRLPPASFDSGRSTGVKGVIADARSFETARNVLGGVAQSTQSTQGGAGGKSESETDSDGHSLDASGEEAFLRQWRETRRQELETETNRAVRTRRTSPSMRVYGRMEEVHYEDIEFDNAAVPALLAYRNQGDLFANLTGIIEMMPDEEPVGTPSLTTLLEKHHVL
ncbi:hypothetical protein UVI_02003070 [Ustilaginoidea virens]|uniref:Phosducin thioredoxin-like domain-containing protein n=1 Tax=Ustilaginoidea virens TaxID=1159556 RepID=A0A1B5L259_USTVR|nr:hypothetical protein UVI_02003070 [Ustilaginoidea virens]